MTTVKLIVILLVISETFLIEGTCSDYISKLKGYTCNEENAIGNGATGTAFVVFKDKHKYVLKVQPNKKKGKDEINILEKLKGLPYITQLIEVSSDKDLIYTVITYGNRGTVSNMMKTTDYFNKFINIMKFFRQVVQAVKSIHNAGYLHMDLKLSNIVVDRNFDPMIIDFDMTSKINSLSDSKGTLKYMAPELIYSFIKDENVFMTDYIDVYALGVIFYKLVKKKYPYNLRDFSYEYLLNQKITFAADDMGTFYEIISKSITPRSSRLSMEEFSELIERYYIKPMPTTLGESKSYSLKERADENELSLCSESKSRFMSPNFIRGAAALAGTVLLGLVFVCIFIKDTKEKEELITKD